MIKDHFFMCLNISVFFKYVNNGIDIDSRRSPLTKIKKKVQHAEADQKVRSHRLKVETIFSDVFLCIPQGFFRASVLF